MRSLHVLLSLVLFGSVFTSCKKESVIENTPPLINVGRDTTIDLTNAKSDSILITGLATDIDGTVVGYLWSEVSGPNTCVIASPGSAATFVSNLIPGKYIFQLMATDNKGATGIRSVSVTIVKVQIQTVTFQLSQSPNELNIGLHNGRNATDPASPELSADAWTSNGTLFITRGLLKFDLSAIPANAKIIPAKLTLYSNPTPLSGDLVHANAGNNNTLLIQKVTSGWSSTTTTWQTQPASDTAAQIVIPHTNQPLLDLTDVDVTALVNSMIAGGNYGFLLKLQNESIYNSRIFCSSKYNDATKHPKLVLQYMK